MVDRYPPTVQRPALLKFLEALGCRDAALRRDECSDWRINGKQGHIYSVPEGFQLIFFARNGVTEWDGAGPHMEDYTRAKRNLVFCRLMQDGTGEGIFLLDRLPTKEEAEDIRDILVIPKKREVSDEERARLAEMGRRFAARRDDVVGEKDDYKSTSHAADGSGQVPTPIADDETAEADRRLPDASP
jgi:hypothetical protein